MNLRADLSTAATTLEPLFVWKKNHSLADAVDFASSTAATLARLGSGAVVAHAGGKRPAKRFGLYEREGCPFSRKVREALSILDLDAIVHPCPKGGSRFVARVKARTGAGEIPMLVDDNADLVLTDSDAIVRHLFATYGDGSVPLTLRSKVSDASSRLASRFRGDKGTRVSPSSEPEGLLELYSYEASPHCRIVREVLSELEIPYLLHNVARRSPRRPAFVELAGKMQVPFLLDPQNDVRMFESREIVRYLENRYAATS